VKVELAELPYERYLDDANHLRYQFLKGKVPEPVARNVIPALCREAIEAAAIDALRRRWLALNRSHDDIEDDLDRTEELTDLLLLLIDNRTKAPEHRVDKGEAYDLFARKLPAGSDDLISDLNRATHEGFAGDVEVLTKRTRALAKHLAALP
jgi:hypothetical protein